MRTLLPRALPCEKRRRTPGHLLLMLRINSPCARWSSRVWHQERLSRCILFLPAQVIQNSINGLLLLNAGNDPGSTSATLANFNIYIENSLEPLHPCHRRVTLCRCPCLCIGGLLQLLATPGRCDLPTQRHQFPPEIPQQSPRDISYTYII